MSEVSAALRIQRGVGAASAALSSRARYVRRYAERLFVSPLSLRPTRTSFTPPGFAAA